MLRKGAVGALGALARLGSTSSSTSRLFSSNTYPIIDHTFDAIVVGAGALQRRNGNVRRPHGPTPSPGPLLTHSVTS